MPYVAIVKDGICFALECRTWGAACKLEPDTNFGWFGTPEGAKNFGDAVLRIQETTSERLDYYELNYRAFGLLLARIEARKTIGSSARTPPAPRREHRRRVRSCR